MKKKKWIRALFRQRFLVASLIILQFAYLIYALISGSTTSVIISRILITLSTLTSVYILVQRRANPYKAIWIFLILLFPLFGGFFFLITTGQSSTRKFRKKVAITEKKAQSLMKLPSSDVKNSEDLSEYARQIRYLQDFAGFPIYDSTETKYLSPGEIKLQYLLAELEKAEKYIFLEYFIIREGEMWEAILDILKKKAATGVTVRVLYDDMGCFTFLPKNYPKILKEYGIECAVFNPFRPFLTVKQNNRDHRKIAVIDGKVAFTGGINLADKYINRDSAHGHWKDSAVMLKGKAAWSFTLMFLQMWELATGADEDYSRYFPYGDEPCNVKASGYVLPYFDSPLDKENVGEHVYMQMLNGARDYVYICTPYLMIDDKMLEAITVAAKSKIDVRIITPSSSDSRAIQTTTRSYYRELIEAGVKIYEYKKGMIHSKTFVSDDRAATVGTTNLDFRSLYMQFECGAWMYGVDAVAELKEDFLRTLEDCEQITKEKFKTNLFYRIAQDVLRIFAPFM